MSINRSSLPLAILFAFQASVVFAQLEFRQIALSGDHAPGTVDQSLFERFYWPQINNVGEVAFAARLATGFGAPVVHGNRVALFGPVSGDGPEFGVVARTNDLAPGTSDNAFYDNFLKFDLNDSGDLAFTSWLRQGAGIAVPPNQDEAIFGPVAGAGSALSLLVREDEAAGTADNAEFAHFQQLRLNSSGEVAFTTGLRTRGGGDPVTFDNDDAVVVANTEGLTWILREGEPAPGTGALFGRPTELAFNDEGEVAFAATLQSGGIEPINEENRRALFGPTGEAESGVQLLVREGDDAPNVSDAAVIDDVLRPQLSNTGQVAFAARLRDESGVEFPDTANALYGPGAELGDEPSLVAREGDPAPGTIDNAKFDTVGSIGQSVAMNNNSDLAFVTRLRTGDDPEVEPQISHALYTHVIGMGLESIVRTGDEFQVMLPDGMTTETREIAAINFVDGGFNDHGEVVFGLQFTDASQGVFTAQTAAVPEPSSIVIFLMLGVMAICKRRFMCHR